MNEYEAGLVPILSYYAHPPLWIGGAIGMFLIYHLPLGWLWVAPIVVFIGFFISWLILVYEKWKRINGNTGG